MIFPFLAEILRFIRIYSIIYVKMKNNEKSELTKIPGVGKNMAQHLIKAGFPTIESLKGKDPEDIYLADCEAQGVMVDRCALYCYRLAVHFAEHNGELPADKQNWWDWKD